MNFLCSVLLILLNNTNKKLEKTLMEFFRKIKILKEKTINYNVTFGLILKHCVPVDPAVTFAFS